MRNAGSVTTAWVFVPPPSTPMYQLFPLGAPSPISHRHNYLKIKPFAPQQGYGAVIHSRSYGQEQGPEDDLHVSGVRLAVAEVAWQVSGLRRLEQLRRGARGDGGDGGARVGARR